MTLLLLFVAYAVLLNLGLWRAAYRPAAGVSSPQPRPRPRPRRILIIGATGGTGRQLVAQALERGFEVTALVRDPERLRLDHPHLTVAQGDVLDAASIDAVMQGQEAVVSALGHKRFLGPTSILSRGTANILHSMKSHGVRSFVCETSLGIGDSAGRMGLYYSLFVIPVILPFYYWDKTRQEQRIASSGSEWVIVRPGALNNGPRRDRIRRGRVGGFLGTARISRADVAAFMLDQLESDQYVGAAPGICW
ncbi:MAG TPA: SDR family oxidoreductase [Thermoanaerobaculia bacterium]|nr:SDR family oxidoreductase [Thermoanaerobaculia bacterium]